MNKQFVVLVNENDEDIGIMEKLQAHEEGLLHRAFSVFIVREDNNEIEFLLQQRATCKYHSGGLWSNTCCSHPNPKEELLKAADRRLFEELGIKNAELQMVDKFIYRAELDNNLCEHELDHIIIGKLSNEHKKFTSNPDEVMASKWISANELYQQVRDNPEQFTAWLPLAIDKLQSHKPHWFK